MPTAVAHSHPKTVAIVAALEALELLLFLALPGSSLTGQEHEKSATAVIEKAIAAHGGKARLVAFQRRRTKTSGVLYSEDTKIIFTAEKWEDLPSREKVVANLKAGEVEQVETRVADHENIWRKIDRDEAVSAPKELQIGMKAGLYSRYIMTLVPILEDKGVISKSLGESVLGKTTVIGVRVSGIDKEDIDLFFDKQKGYLVRCITKPSDPNSKNPPLDELFSEFKDLEGLKYPTLSTAYYGGKKFQERKVIELEVLKSIDKVFFEKP